MVCWEAGFSWFFNVFYLLLLILCPKKLLRYLDVFLRNLALWLFGVNLIL